MESKESIGFFAYNRKCFQTISMQAEIVFLIQMLLFLWRVRESILVICQELFEKIFR